MPEEKTIERRVRGSYRARACTAGLCTGAQIFLAGCAVGMPVALTGAWMASLLSLPFAAWLTVRAQRVLGGQGRSSMTARVRYALLALALLMSGAFAALSLVSFASAALAEQASHAWTEMTALLAIALCAASGGVACVRLGFALRYVLPVLLLGLSLSSAPLRVPVGLFPILGAGEMEMGAAAIAMLFGAAPALMLMLPPPEIERAGAQAEGCPVPQTRFFLFRVLAGALAGAFLLFLTCALTTYESIANSGEWGARLRMAVGDQPHEGVMQMLLMTAKLLAMLLLSVNMLCAGHQALLLAFPSLAKSRLSWLLPFFLIACCLAVKVLWGDAPLLFAAPGIALPAALAAILAGRRRRS